MAFAKSRYATSAQPYLLCHSDAECRGGICDITVPDSRRDGGVTHSKAPVRNTTSLALAFECNRKFADSAADFLRFQRGESYLQAS